MMREAGTRDAVTPDDAARVRLGASMATPAEMLLKLAHDPSVTVRTALTLNPAVPPVALGVLARDVDERVRALLARKLAVLAPSLTETEQSHLHQQTVNALAVLVEDEAVRVRAAIAEVVKEMPAAPRDLVLRLARDAAFEVSEPVIRLSPLLTDADLLGLLDAATSPAMALAVARRPGLAADVADKVAETADAAAIRDMLLNQSAQIRESTLDALIARAANQISWHEPLVRRPHLSVRAAEALSWIVADALLAELASRADLAPSLATDLRARMSTRLRQPAGQPASPVAGTPSGALAGTLSEASIEARAYAAAGRLTEADLLAVVGRGDARLAAAMLAVAADVPPALVERASTLRSAKGVVSLVWRAGFSMKLAVPLQSLLGRLTPASLLKPGPGSSFPLTIEEMRWQLDFLGRGSAQVPASPFGQPPGHPPYASS
jgi:uncharacterized protein (DUF2336 family)